MPKITHLFKTYFPDTQGGLEEAIRQIAKSTLVRGYEVEVLCISSKSDLLKVDNITVRTFSEFGRFPPNPISFHMIFQLASILKNTDILHIHSPWPFGEMLVLAILATGAKVPFIVTYHCDIHRNNLLKIAYYPFYKMLLNRANKVAVTSARLAQNTSILEKYRSKTEIVHLWLDEERFNYDLEYLETESSFLRDTINEHEYCVFIGVLRWYKGLDVLIDAAKKVHKNKKVLIIGKGPLYEHLSNRISQEKITNVHMLGFLSDLSLKNVLSKANFLVLPSISPAEAFGQVLLEASRHKKAMVTTSLGTGTDFVNEHKNTGLVVKPNDTNELASAINYLFSNTTECLTFGANAFRRYRSMFSQESQAPKYFKIYSDIIDEQNEVLR